MTQDTLTADKKSYALIYSYNNNTKSCGTELSIVKTLKDVYISCFVEF